jgi:hypothetical protein
MKSLLGRAVAPDQTADTSESGQSKPAAEPSWFLDTANQQPRDLLIERYRRSLQLADPARRRALEQRSASAPIPYRDLIAAKRLGVSELMEDMEASRHRRDRRVHAHQSERLSLPKTYAIAALAAVISGGSVGYVASKFDTLKTQAMALFSTGPSAKVPEITVAASVAPATPKATVIGKKQVATATLKVADVTGQTNSLIPLALHAEPALADQDLLLKISGLPDTAYLTSGHKGADRVWALTLDDLEDVKLMVPDAGQRDFDVAVAAFERKTGELAAPIKSMTVALSDVQVHPAAAPSPFAIPARGNDTSTALPAPIPVPTGTSASLVAAREMTASRIAKGDLLLKSGDLSMARQLYELAWSEGSADGALALARSYDPIVHAALKVRGGTPDARRAIEWYERAARAGKPDAYAAIIRLRLKPQ